ncbi:MAG: hypothetical protein ABIN95_01815 [Mucilaginibacter sp.]
MFKTETILFLAIASILQIGCKFGSETKKNTSSKEFEGIITYHEIVKSSDGINVDDTVQLFYSDGNYVGIHSEKSSKFHLVKDYYLKSKPLRLLLFNNSDTLHQLSLNFPIEKLERFEVKEVKDKILSRKCEMIKVSTSYNERDSTTYSDMSFIFSRGYLKINKQHFKNWNLGFFNKVVGESGVFYLKFKSVHFDSSHKNILSSKTYDVISVKEVPINPKVFEINTAMIDGNVTAL